jgi:hypothetical protein
VDTSANEWAHSITFYSADQVGQAQWFHHMADDIPQADISKAKHESSIAMAGIGYGYTLEELGYAMLVPGTNLTSDRAVAARRAYEQFVDGVALIGDAAKNFTGLFNAAGVTAVDVPNDGTGAARAWSTKTPAFISRDFNLALSTIYSDTMTTELADTVLLPISVFQYLSSIPFSATADLTILEWLQRTNVYTATTGQPLLIRAVRGLEVAGANGDGRMVAYRRSPEVLKMHIPMPHRFLPVWQTGPIKFDVPGIFRLGGLEVRLPKAVRYQDAVSAAP